MSSTSDHRFDNPYVFSYLTVNVAKAVKNGTMAVIASERDLQLYKERLSGIHEEWDLGTSRPVPHTTDHIWQWMCFFYVSQTGVMRCERKKKKSSNAGSPCVTPVQAGTVTPAPIPIRKRSLPLPQLVTKPLGMMYVIYFHYSSLWEGLRSSVIACERQTFLLAHRRWDSLSSDERGETSQATFVIDVTVKKDSLLVMYLHAIFRNFGGSH